MSFVNKLFSRVPTRPNVGAVARLTTIQSNKKHNIWLRRLLGSGSWLMLLGAIIITWFPLSQQVEMNRSAIFYILAAYFLYILLLEYTSRRFKESYESYGFQWTRIGINLVVVSLLVLFSSGQYSYFWFFYTLPIFQTIIYFDFWHTAISVPIVIGLYFAVAFSSLSISNMPIDGASFLMQSFILIVLGFILYWLFGSAQTVYQLRDDEIEALRSTTGDLTNNYDRQELLQTIIHWAVSLLKGTGGGIYEFDATKGILEVIADHGGKTSIRGRTLKIGQGMAGRVMQNGQHLIVNNYQTWPGRADVYAKELFRAVVSVPLIWQGNPLGVLYVTDDAVNRKFQDRDAYVLELLANQAAVAMLEETRRRAGELERKTQQLRMLNEIGHIIGTAPTLEDMLQAALAHGLPGVRTNEGSIMLVDQKTKVLEIKAWLVRGEIVTDKVHRQFKQDEGIVGHVYTTSEAYICHDVESDPLFTESFTGRKFRSLICVPILVRGRPVGLINADSKHQAFFTKSDQQFLATVAGHLTTALEKFRLREIGTELSTVNLDILLDRIVESASLLTGAEYITLFLAENNGQQLYRARNFPPDRATDEPPRPSGLSYEILKSGQPTVINDVQDNPRVKTRSKQDRLTAVMGVPLKLENRNNSAAATEVIGVIWANTRQREIFGKRDIKLLDSLASQAALAIENARLVEALRERTLVLEELYKTSLELTRYKKTPELVRSILDRSVKLLRANGGGLYLLDSAKSSLKLVAASNMAADFEGRSYEIGPSVIGQVVNTKRPFRVSDYRNWPNRLQGYDTLNFTAVVAVPIMWQEQIWGVITVRDVQEGREFSQEEEDLLILLGNLAAIALENSRQHETLERLMESAIHAIIAINEEGEILSCNEQAEHLLGYTTSELIGNSVETLYFLRDDARIIKKRMLTNKNGRLTDHSTYIRSKTGERIPIRLSASLLYDYEGNRAGSVGFFRDQRKILSIMRQVEVLKELHKTALEITSHESTPRLVDSILQRAVDLLKGTGGALYLLDEKDRKTATIAAVCDLPNKLIRQTIIVGDNLVGKVVVSKKPELITEYHKWPHRLPLFEEYQFTTVAAAPIIWQDKVSGVIVVHSDRKGSQLEGDALTLTVLSNLGSLAAIALENVQRPDRLDSLMNSSFDAVIAANSEGYLTELNRIRQLEDEVQTMHTVNLVFVLLTRWLHQAKQKVFALEEHVDYLINALPAGLYDDILSSMRESLQELEVPARTLLEGAEQGVQQARVPMDLREMIRKQIHQLVEKTEADISPRIIASKDEEFIVMGSELLLETAVSLILENAVQSMKQKGVPGKLTVQCDLQNENVHVTVADTGEGIPEDIQQDLYHKPVRSDSGFGYGSLTIAHILRFYKGDISIKESSPQGTQITFFLPSATPIRDN